VRVLLASASAVRRAGLETVVKSDPRLKLVGSLSNPRAIEQRGKELQADVILIDLERQSQFAFSGRSSLPTVFLIDNPDPGWAAQSLRGGVKAILSRDTRPEEILSAIQAAHSGLVLLSAEITRKLTEHVRAPSQQNGTPLERLTSRELEVLGMLAEGLGNRQIADRLGLSDHTIKFHIGSILDKLDASTRTEAVTAALRMGLILL
jgi:two-component system, NarL family, response regulator YdfI